MNRLLELLGSPISDLIGRIGGVIDNLHTSEGEKLEAHARLVAFEAEFTKAVIEADQKLYETQASLIKAEIQSEDWLPRNVRPLIMASFALLVFFNYGIRPLLGDVPVELPDDFWFFLSIGFTGYVGARTYEKAHTKKQ